VEKRNKQLCTKLALFTRLYRDARSTKLKKKNTKKERYELKRGNSEKKVTLLDQVSLSD
jgi:hypothetical protein